MTWNLVDKNTGAPIRVGDKVKSFRDEDCEVKGIYEPGTSQGGRSGRVLLKLGTMTTLYFPSVINAQWDENLPEVKAEEINGTVSQRRTLARDKGYEDD